MSNRERLGLSGAVVMVGLAVLACKGAGQDKEESDKSSPSLTADTGVAPATTVAATAATTATVAATKSAALATPPKPDASLSAACESGTYPAGADHACVHECKEDGKPNESSTCKHGEKCVATGFDDLEHPGKSAHHRVCLDAAAMKAAAARGAKDHVALKGDADGNTIGRCPAGWVGPTPALNDGSAECFRNCEDAKTQKHSDDACNGLNTCVVVLSGSFGCTSLVY